MKIFKRKCAPVFTMLKKTADQSMSCCCTKLIENHIMRPNSHKDGDFWTLCYPTIPSIYVSEQYWSGGHPFPFSYNAYIHIYLCGSPIKRYIGNLIKCASEFGWIYSRTITVDDWHNKMAKSWNCWLRSTR